MRACVTMCVCVCVCVCVAIVLFRLCANNQFVGVFLCYGIVLMWCICNFLCTVALSTQNPSCILIVVLGNMSALTEDVCGL